MLVVSVKQLIKKIVFPTYTHEKIYVIDQTNLTKKVAVFDDVETFGEMVHNNWKSLALPF